MSIPNCQTVELSSPNPDPSPKPTDWLSQLDLSIDTLPDLRKKAKGKAKPYLKHIKGEKHKFIPVKASRIPIREPRKLVGEAIPKVFRDFWITNLERATYSPRHMIGISPFWPSHLNLTDSCFM